MARVKNTNIEDSYSGKISALLSLITRIACEIAASDFFGNKQFMLSEAYENLNDSYNLIKLGYYKHAYANLRIARDCALYSIYYSEYSDDFKNYLSSRVNSPKINRDFWNKIINMSPMLKKYNEKWELKNLFNPQELNNYIHTKGMFYSNLGFLTRYSWGEKQGKPIDAQETYNLWCKEFLSIVKEICTLHLLRFPLLAHIFSDSLLSLKFGIPDKYPWFGGLHGDHTDLFLMLMSKEELDYIRELAYEDKHCIEVVNWLNSLPDLSDAVLEKHDNFLNDHINKLLNGDTIEIGEYLSSIKNAGL